MINVCPNKALGILSLMLDPLFFVFYLGFAALVGTALVLIENYCYSLSNFDFFAEIVNLFVVDED